MKTVQRIIPQKRLAFAKQNFMMSHAEAKISFIEPRETTKQIKNKHFENIRF